MKKKYILLSFIFIIFCILTINTKVYANDLDEIKNYVVTVDPRMNDGSLDITYEITWKVLDSTTEGPLEWVQIGTPNENFDNPTPYTKNIRSINKYNGAYVKITFDRAYKAGEEIKFKYSIHQPYMHKVSWGNCKYEFTPAWFTNAKVDMLTIKWNKDKVKKSNTKSTEGNYLVWYKTNLDHGEKLTVSIKYDKKSFSALGAQKKSSFTSSSGSYMGIWIILFIVVVVLSLLTGGRRRIL